MIYNNFLKSQKIQGTKSNNNPKQNHKFLQKNKQKLKK